MKLLGVLVIVAGIVLGLYVGVWLCFIGGIVQLVEAIKASPVSATGIAWGVLRILVSTCVGGAIFWFCTLVGGFFFAISR